MDPRVLIEQLEAGAAALTGVTAGLTTAQAAWRPEPSQWAPPAARRRPVRDRLCGSVVTPRQAAEADA